MNAVMVLRCIWQRGGRTGDQEPFPRLGQNRGRFPSAAALAQLPGAPLRPLTCAAPGFATIWWTPPTPGFVLQSTDSLTPTNWVNAPTGTNNPATVPAALPARFYRLFKP